MSKQDKMNERIRQTPLLARLKKCSDRIAELTALREPPHITISPQFNDDDMYIILTIDDAIAEIERLTNENQNNTTTA